jgi:putative ABC transport system permease protein
MCSSPPGENLVSFGVVLPEHDGDAERRILFYHSYVDPDYVKVMGLNIPAGRFFDVASPGDSSQVILMNEAGAKSIGGNIINRSFDIPKFFTQGNNRKEVVGLVSDFHFASLHSNVQPLVLEYNPGRCGYLLLRLAPGSGGDAVATTGKVWRDLLPETPFDYYFVNDEFQNDFNNEQRLKAIVFTIAAISIVLAGLGIFGSTLFLVQSKTKEVAIRKVLGSERIHLLVLLFKPLLISLGIASFFGIPLAYFSGMEWLSGYPYHVDFSSMLYIVSFLVILFVMVVTIVYHYVKVTGINPVNVLKQDN